MDFKVRSRNIHNYFCNREFLLFFFLLFLTLCAFIRVLRFLRTLSISNSSCTELQPIEHVKYKGLKNFSTKRKTMSNSRYNIETNHYRPKKKLLSHVPKSAKQADTERSKI
jgi:hypothetical protein